MYNSWDVSKLHKSASDRLPISLRVSGSETAYLRSRDAVIDDAASEGPTRNHHFPPQAGSRRPHVRHSRAAQHLRRCCATMAESSPPLKLDIDNPSSLPPLPEIAAAFLVRFDHRKGFGLS
jgi:hypothetical protein